MVKTSTTISDNTIKVVSNPKNSLVMTLSKETDTPVKSWDEMYNELLLSYGAACKIGFVMRNFLRQYLETIEGIHVTDPSSLSVEHRIEYIECAQFMQDNFGRVNNMIKEFKELI